MFAVFKKSNKRKKFLSFYQKSKQIEVSLCSNAKRKYLHIVQLQAIFFANFFNIDNETFSFAVKYLCTF